MMVIDDDEDLKIISQYFGYIVDYSYIADTCNQGQTLICQTYHRFFGWLIFLSFGWLIFLSFGWLSEYKLCVSLPKSRAPFSYTLVFAPKNTLLRPHLTQISNGLSMISTCLHDPHSPFTNDFNP